MPLTTTGAGTPISTTPSEIIYTLTDGTTLLDTSILG
jgi:hypothetical protein